MSQDILAVRRASCSTLTTDTFNGIGGNMNVEMRFKFSGTMHDRLHVFVQQHFNDAEHLKFNHISFFNLRCILLL